jgi:TolB-like protein
MRIALVLAPAIAAAQPSVRLAVMPLQAGESVPDKTAGGVTEAVAAEVRRVPGVQVITQQEVSAVLTLEQQRQLVGCETDACVADLAGALGVERIVTGSIAKLGESWLLHLKLIDVKKVATVAQSDRRHRGGSIDDVLDGLPEMAAELFPGYAPAPTRGGARPSAMSAPAAPAPAVAPAWADEPMDASAMRPRLKLATDGKGAYLAFIPFGSSDEPFFYGDAQKLYAQRIYGRFVSGREVFDFGFWEPRSKSAASFEFRDGKYALSCNGKDTALTLVPDAEAAKLLDAARFLKSRWKRHAYALARDDGGAYYYVDQAREPEENTDFRFYTGLKGKLALQELVDAIVDTGGSLFVTEQGRLRVFRDEEGKERAEWLVGGKKTPLTLLDLSMNAAMIYTSLGVYKGETLGTPCDGRL